MGVRGCGGWRLEAGAGGQWAALSLSETPQGVWRHTLLVIGRVRGTACYLDTQASLRWLWLRGQLLGGVGTGTNQPHCGEGRKGGDVLVQVWFRPMNPAGCLAGNSTVL